jgi:hypothetical protein
MWRKKIKRLYRRYLKYEKYLVWFVGTVAFCALIMWLAKRIFVIYIPFANWKAFLETVGVLAFLTSLFSAWSAWSGERRQVVRVAAARKEEQIIALLEKHERMLSRHDAIEENLRQICSSISSDIDEMRASIGRLSAQVQQTEAEAIMRRKITAIEEKLNRLSK